MDLKTKEPLNMIITGVGGQGNVLISRLIGQAMVEDGYNVKIGETFGASQRGGSVTSHVRVSKKSEYGAIIPDGQADLILGLEPMESLRSLATCGNPQSIVISNTRPINPMCVATGEIEYPPLDELKKNMTELSAGAYFVDASDIALDLGVPLITNVIMAGALIGLGITSLRQDLFVKQLEAIFKKDRLALNLKALERGMTCFKK